MYSRATSERTYGGEGRRYVGSSGERGRDVDMSMRVVASLKVREIVTASRGLRMCWRGCVESMRITHLAGHPSVKLTFDIRVA